MDKADTQALTDSRTMALGILTSLTHAFDSLAGTFDGDVPVIVSDAVEVAIDYAGNLIPAPARGIVLNLCFAAEGYVKPRLADLDAGTLAALHLGEANVDAALAHLAKNL